MRRFRLTTLLILLVPCGAFPSAAFAQGQERFLPAGSQIFLRFDGVDMHRDVFDKSALGKTLNGDTGKFLVELGKYIRETGAKALQDFAPGGEEMVKGLEMMDEVLGVLGSFGRNGFLVGVEVKSLNPPQVEAVLVFPKSADKLMSVINKALKLAGMDVQQSKEGQRTIHHVGVEGVAAGWWNEGGDAVVVLGTTSPTEHAKRAAANDPGLTKNPLFKEVAGFKDFPTWGRAFVDTTSLFKQVANISNEAGQLIDELGLTGVTHVTMVSGFEGAAERTIIDIHTPGPRKGLLKLLNRSTISLKDLPPLPNDLTSFSVSNFNVGKLYDGILEVAGAGIKVFAGGAVPDPKEAIRQIEGIFGISLSDDLFGSFDNLFVSYSSPSEGFLGLGSVWLLKLKDQKKLEKALVTLQNAIPNIPGAGLKVQKKEYQGVTTAQLIVQAMDQEFSLGAVTLHDGWLAYAGYPQPIYGFIHRTKGDLPVWKADESLTKALAAFPKEFTSISVSDPRPGMQQLLAYIPGILTLGNSFLPQFAPGYKQFDVSVIPHAQAAMRHLFPNITVSTDDGKKLRIETRASIKIPLLN